MLVAGGPAVPVGVLDVVVVGTVVGIVGVLTVVGGAVLPPGWHCEYPVIIS